MLYVIFKLSQLEKCPGMLSGFPLVGIPVYSPSIFPRYLEFFLLKSLRLHSFISSPGCTALDIENVEYLFIDKAFVLSKQ